MRRTLIMIVVVLLLATRAMAGDMKHPSFAGAVHTGDPIVAGVNNTALTPISPKLIASLYANLPVEQDGQLLYCSDCLKASPCVGGGTGAFAFGQRGAWQCSPPPQEGDLNMGGHRIINDAAPAASGDTLSEGHAIGAVTAIPSIRGNVNGVINVQNYGAKCDSGTTDNGTAFANAITAALAAGASHAIYVPGCAPGGFYQVGMTATTSGINLSAPNAALSTTNGGVTFYGDGQNLSTIRCHHTDALPANNDKGVCVDLSGAAYFRVAGLRIDSGANASDTARVNVLLGKTCTGGALQFSGLGSFENVLLGAAGDYDVYDVGAEQIDFNNVNAPPGSATTVPFVFSVVNTAGITSPNVTLNYPADSMTAISFRGFRQALGSAAAEAVLLDIGSPGGGAGTCTASSTKGIASISFEGAYFNLSNATGIAIATNGAGSSVIDSIECRNCKVEANGGAGTNQVFSLSAGAVSNVFFTGVLSSGVAQTAAEFVWSNPLVNAYIDWGANDAGTFTGASLLSTSSVPAAKASIFKSDTTLAKVINGINMNPANGASGFVMGSDAFDVITGGTGVVQAPTGYFAGVQLTAGTFASCSTCAAGTEGMLCAVKDDNTACAFGATVTGSGTHHVLAYCDGTQYVMTECK